tara:strand:- start:1943 stop:2386 length:444 start_codon:yes stop_codon:yes gene_type:complete
VNRKAQKTTGKDIRDSERVKGWKIDLRPYKQKLSVFNEQGMPVMRGTEQVEEVVDFDVKETLAGMCFTNKLMENPDIMFKAKAIADKIRAANNSVIVDNDEMEHLREAYALVNGLPERFIEYLERIRDAEEIRLKEDSETPADDKKG